MRSWLLPSLLALAVGVTWLLVAPGTAPRDVSDPGMAGGEPAARLPRQPRSATAPRLRGRRDAADTPDESRGAQRHARAGRTLEILVRDSDGNAVEQAQVEVDTASGWPLPVVAGRVPGTWVVRVPGRDGVRVRARRADGLFDTEGRAVSQRGAERVVVDLLARQPCTVVHLLGPRRRPIAEGRALTVAHGGGGGPWRGHALEGPSLRLDATLLARRWRIVGARADDGTPLAATALPSLPEPPAEIDVALALGRSITGRVRDQHGAPVGGAVILAHPHPDGEEPPGDPPCDAASVTDEEGVFRLQGLAEGSYDLRAQVPRRYTTAPGPAVLAGTQDVEITVTRLVGLTIEVRDTAGRPVEGAHVRVIEREGERDWSRTDALGEARLHVHWPESEARLVVLPPVGERRMDPLTREGWLPRDDQVVLPGP